MPGKSIFVFLIVVPLLHPVDAGARPDAAAQAETPCVAVPRIVQTSRPLERIIEEMWRRSLTFRGQVVRLGSEPDLVITIQACPRCLAQSRAQTTVIRDRGILQRADVQVQVQSIVSGEIVEVLAHELEHVIEQIEGIDLARLVRLKSPAVHQNGSRFETARYETARAHNMGLRVAEEYRAGLGVIAPCNEGTR